MPAILIFRCALSGSQIGILKNPYDRNGTHRAIHRRCGQRPMVLRSRMVLLPATDLFFHCEMERGNYKKGVSGSETVYQVLLDTSTWPAQAFKDAYGSPAFFEDVSDAQ